VGLSILEPQIFDIFIKWYAGALWGLLGAAGGCWGVTGFLDFFNASLLPAQAVLSLHAIQGCSIKSPIIFYYGE